MKLSALAAALAAMPILAAPAAHADWVWNPSAARYYWVPDRPYVEHPWHGDWWWRHHHREEWREHEHPDRDWR